MEGFLLRFEETSDRSVRDGRERGQQPHDGPSNPAFVRLNASYSAAQNKDVALHADEPGT